MQRRTDKPEAKERILDAAEKLFAEKGYRAVTVREITEAAGCNIASVNYHFGSKKGLYLQVFERRWVPRAERLGAYFRKQVEEEPDMEGSPLAGALAAAMLSGPLTEEERKRHHQLAAREMTQPTEAFTLLAQKAFEPMFRLLSEHLRETYRWEDEQTLALCTFSLLGLSLYFNLARPLVSWITGQEYDQDFARRLTRHIARFAGGGLAACGKERKSP
ncbi:MAG: CerR family C-terminal domain-containing protein [Deltaproteobacteria bacterium]|nr:CerR family C-terminal domain-containing protein [Deltaproteobacteria bacterium]